MKLLFSAILLISFTIPAMSQDNNNSLSKNFKNQAKILMNLMRSEKLKEKAGVLCQKPDFGNKNYRYIPIPPAAKWNSQSELLPLYKEGTRATVSVIK